MSEKVKISNDIANAIKWFKEMQKDKFNITDIDELLNIATDWWLREEFHEFKDLHVVHELKFIDFCNALYYGYDVELTPEEKILDDYKTATYNVQHGQNTDYWAGYRNAILNTLNFNDVKIKGVNE